MLDLTNLNMVAWVSETCQWSVRNKITLTHPSAFEGCHGKYPAIFNISRTCHVALMYLAASQRRPYCASVNSHSPVGLVSRQWDAVDWTCVLCDRRIHNDRASRSASSRQYACPIYSSHAGFFFWQSITSPRSVSPPTEHIWLPVTYGFSQS